MAAPFNVAAAARFSKHFRDLLLLRPPTRHVQGITRNYVGFERKQQQESCCCLAFDRNKRPTRPFCCQQLVTTAVNKQSLSSFSVTWPVLQRHLLQPRSSTATRLDTFDNRTGVLHRVKCNTCRFEQTCNLVTVPTSKQSLRSTHKHPLLLFNDYCSLPHAIGASIRGLRNVPRDAETETIEHVQRQAEDDGRPSQGQGPSNNSVAEQNAGWLIRLANENGYLSWCRNVYIATVVAVTMYAQDGIIPYAKEAAFTLILLGGLNLLSGTSVFLTNILRLRTKMLMSRLTALYNCLIALIQLLLWGGAVALFMGFVQEEFEEEEQQQEQQEQQAKRKPDRKNV